MVNIPPWNRKECAPDQTVEKIRCLLDSLGIATRITNERDYDDCWHSVRLELSQLPGLGANGKGISRDFSRASAYAELFERLYSGYLLGHLFRNKFRTQDNSGIRAVVNAIGGHLAGFVRNTRADEIESFMKSNPAFAELEAYQDVFTQKQVLLPDTLISCVCASNGLAAGNSAIEASVQGIAELFERYVSRLMFFDADFARNCMTIEERLYAHTHAYTMIQKIKRRGYGVYVKDCSMGGKLPVLAIIIVNPSKTKYSVRFGADINLDICIQRCITETFQGLDFQTNYRLAMSDFDANYDDFWHIHNSSTEFYCTVINGQGNYPRSFFLSGEEVTYTTLVPWTDAPMSNENVLALYSDMIQSLGMKLFLRDFSTDEFATVRVYVPGMSEIIMHDMREVIDVYTRIKKLQKVLRSVCKEDAMTELYECLLPCLGMKFFSNDYSLEKLLGIHTSEPPDSLYKRSMHYFATILCLCIGKPAVARKHLEADQHLRRESTRAAYIQKLVLDVVEAGMSYADFLPSLQFLLSADEQTYAAHVHRLYQDHCTRLKSLTILTSD